MTCGPLGLTVVCLPHGCLFELHTRPPSCGFVTVWWLPRGGHNLQDFRVSVVPLTQNFSLGSNHHSTPGPCFEPPGRCPGFSDAHGEVVRALTLQNRDQSSNYPLESSGLQACTEL